jgi:DUF1680 family protein
MRKACEALFEDITERQMYVTGAIGATATGESFTTGYDLPNDTMYGETCASVGLMMFARRMNALTGEARYAEIMELALYNRVLAGISLSGTEFFYANPQECEPERIANNPALSHIKTVRQKWFDCSCCPTNIARTIMGLGAYAYGLSEDGLYVNLYVGGKAKAKNLTLEVETDYPYGDDATITVRGGRGRLYLRNPESSPVVSLKLNGETLPIKAENGYIVLERDWNGETLRLTFDMTPRLVYSSPKVQGNVGKAAVKRGPLVYCAEDTDNESTLGRILLPQNVRFSLGPAPQALPENTVTLETPVYRYYSKSDRLHSAEPPSFIGAAVALVPYFLWGNRGENEMRVYLNTAPLLPGSR